MRHSSTLKIKARQALWHVSPRAYRRIIRPARGQIFSIGILRGKSLFDLRSCAGMNNPVLTARDVDDVPAAFVADPFLARRGEHWFMFFEVMNDITRRGEIAVAASPDGLHWQYDRVVLSEPFHLAYPHVFEWRGDMLMVPDSPGHGVRLYRARRFPYDWEVVSEITSENLFSDSSLFQHGDRWWMLSGWMAKKGDPMSLRLFSAVDPRGPWKEHPASPIVQEDNRSSRPAGRVQIIDGYPHRFAQDCASCYGERVRSFRIVELSACRYQEQPTCPGAVLEAGSELWRSGGMHHIDAQPLANGQWLACVDGWFDSHAHV